MERTVGVFVLGRAKADQFWNQCDEPYGRHRGLVLRANDADADHVLCVGTPVPPGRRARLPWWSRWPKSRRSAARLARTEEVWDRAGLDPARTDVLHYEPPTNVTDADYAVARRRASRVFGPDARATHPLVLPATWMADGTLAELRDEAPPAKPVCLATVTSGKAWLDGHRARLGFLDALRRAGVPFELFGSDLPPPLRGRGPVASKSQVLRPARFALAIENYAEGDLYVTEKLWDPLLCWSLPLYFGSRAADRLVPPESFVRLPDLGAGGVDAVRAAVARPSLWEERLDAVAEARRRALGDLRLVEWIRREVVAPNGAAASPRA
jgi:hypothetical protein